MMAKTHSSTSADFQQGCFMRLHLVVPLLTLLATSAGAAPRTDEYAQGIEITSYSGRPLVEMLLPDLVYQKVTRADLADVRVFNATGVAVPHAFCAAPVTMAPVIERKPLPVFDLQAARAASGGGASVDIETAAGTQVRIQEGNGGGAVNETGTHTWAHVIDARVVTGNMRAIEFDWTSPDGASQAKVRIEASDDLDRWQTLVPSSTLLRVTRDEAQLQRNVVSLPVGSYQYLRVVRTDGWPSLQLAEVIGETVTTPQAVDPLWFNAFPVASAEPAELLFDAMRTAPVAYARLGLPGDNTSVRVTLYSRPDDKAQWNQRWTGEFYAIVNDDERRTSPPAVVGPTDDRYWRVAYASSSAPLDPAPVLELGYRPARLRFVAQGEGPYILAFGSRRAEPAPVQRCESLLADVQGEDLAALIGEGIQGGFVTLAGDVAFKPLPQKTPVRLIILWGALIAGVAVLIGMALALLKRVRHE